MTRYTEMFDVTIDLDITKIDVPEDAIDDAISDIRGVVIANGAWGNKTEFDRPVVVERISVAVVRACIVPEWEDVPEDAVDVLQRLLTTLHGMHGIRVQSMTGRAEYTDGTPGVLSWVNGAIFDSADGTTGPVIDPDAAKQDLIAAARIRQRLQDAGASPRELAIFNLGARLNDPEDSGVFTPEDITATLSGK